MIKRPATAALLAMRFFAEAEFGAVLPGGARVSLVVSRGKKRR